MRILRVSNWDPINHVNTAWWPLNIIYISLFRLSRIGFLVLILLLKLFWGDIFFFWILALSKIIWKIYALRIGKIVFIQSFHVRFKCLGLLDDLQTFLILRHFKMLNKLILFWAAWVIVSIQHLLVLFISIFGHHWILFTNIGFILLKSCIK